MKYEKIKFLLDSEEEVIESSDALNADEIYSVRYNLLRYYTILLKEFLKELKP